MADYQTVVHEKNRMCKAYPTCRECPLSTHQNRCDAWMHEHPEEAERVVMMWSEDHPEKFIFNNTDRSDELEVYAAQLFLQDIEEWHSGGTDQ